MNERIQRALDGDEAARAALDPREATELAKAETLIQNVVRGIPAQPLPDLGPAVLRRLAISADATPRKAAPSPLTAIGAWLWSPRPLSIQLRPAYAVAFAALVGVFLLRPLAVDPTASPLPQVLVQFRLDAPNAHQVQLAGNFTDWKADVVMKRTGTGVWTVVLPLAPGVHKYAFVVDGENWVPDPMAQAVSDGFGGVNSQLAVLSPDKARAL